MNWQRACESGYCVEIRVDRSTETVQVRDTKDPTGAMLTFDFDEWRQFAEYVKQGEVDV